MKAGAEGGVNLVEELVIETFEPSGPFFFRNAEQKRNLLRRGVARSSETFLDGRNDHMDEFGKTAPRLFQGDLAADDPFAAFVHETRFGKVIDDATDSGTG